MQKSSFGKCEIILFSQNFLPKVDLDDAKGVIPLHWVTVRENSAN